jgi:ribose transport system substrate-binding protein
MRLMGRRVPRIVPIVVFVAFVFAACSSSATQAPAAAPSAAPAASAAAPSAAPAASAAAPSAAPAASAAAASAAPAASAAAASAAPITAALKFAQPCASGGKPVRIAVFVNATANTFYQANVQAAQDTAKLCGATISKVFDGNYTASTMFAQLQDAVASGQYDAFVISPGDGGVVTPVIKTAIAKGIKVACMLIDCGPNLAATQNQIPGMITTVGYSFAENGAYIGDAAGQACLKINPCKVVYLIGRLDAPPEQLRTKGFEQELKLKYPNAQIVAEQAGNEDTGVSRTVMTNILQAHPDVNVVASAGDQMTLGAQQAVDAAGLTGKVALIGDGAAQAGVSAVAAGTWFATVANLPYTEGVIATTAVIAAVRGLAPPYPTWVDELQYSPVGTVIYQSNAAQFTAEWKG